MTTAAHIAYPSLTYVAITQTTPVEFSYPLLVILLIFSVLPDFDFLYQIARGKWFDKTFTHHKWISHKPLTYLPFILLAFYFKSPALIIASAGVYSHLFLDMFFVADGIAWLYPLSDKQFQFLSDKTKGAHGTKWIDAYRKLPIFKIDIVAFLLLIIVVVTDRIVNFL